MESLTQFESRKQDHLRLALDPQVQTGGLDLDQIELIHEALPEINFSEISIKSEFQGVELSTPFFISSMTAGNAEGQGVNQALAALSSSRQILMGVGSQRRELQDPEARLEWKKLRQESPRALLMGNLGLAQVIQTPVSAIEALIESLEAIGLFIHLNPLQEALQKEGTTDFRGGFKKISELCQKLSVPVVVKEVGCGFSVATLQRLNDSGVTAVDVSGYGGTHWGRIEGLRAEEFSPQAQAAQTFSNWGITTLRSLLNAREASAKYEIWASGGLRNGLEAAKLLALGARRVGLAQPWLSALKSESKLEPLQRLEVLADRLNYELKTALFCTGCSSIEELQGKRVWQWRQKI